MQGIVSCTIRSRRAASAQKVMRFSEKIMRQKKESQSTMIAQPEMIAL